MAIGIKGPIGIDNLYAYCITRTIHLVGRACNRITCKCKVCGAPIDKGHGTPVEILEGRSGQFRGFFICPQCTKLVKTAVDRLIQEGIKADGKPKTDR